MIRKFLKYTFFLSVIIATVAIFVNLNNKNVSAAGGYGPGYGGSCGPWALGCGYPDSVNTWAKFYLSGTGPDNLISDKGISRPRGHAEYTDIWNMFKKTCGASNAVWLFGLFQSKNYSDGTNKYTNFAGRFGYPGYYWSSSYDSSHIPSYGAATASIATIESQAKKYNGGAGININNNTGWFCWQDSWDLPAKWKVDGATDVSVNGGTFKDAKQTYYQTSVGPIDQNVNVYPGDNIQWRHYLRNAEGSNSNTQLRNELNDKFSGSGFTSGVVSRENTLKGGLNPGGGTHYTGSYGNYTVQSADIGNTLCQNSKWFWASGYGSQQMIDGWRYSNKACVTVLNPFTTTGETQMKVNSTQYNNSKSSGPSNDDYHDVKVGDKVGWNFQIKNKGPSTTTTINASGRYHADFGGVSFAKSGTITNGGTMNWDGGTGKSFSSPLTITPDMAGKTWCGYIEKWSPVSGTGGTGGTGAECAKVNYDYKYTCPAFSGQNCDTNEESKKNKTGPQTWVNDKQPTATCKNIGAKVGETAAGATSTGGCLILTTSGAATADVNFKHTATNFGPTKRWDPTKLSSKHSMDPGGTWGTVFTDRTWAVVNDNATISGLKDSTTQTESTFKVNFANDVGKIWCTQISINPGGYNNGVAQGAISSAARCAHVAYNYEISVSGEGNVSTGSDGKKNCDGSNTQIGTETSLKYVITARSGLIGGSTATKSLPIYWRVIDDAGRVISDSQIDSHGNANGSSLAPGKTVNISVKVPASNTVGQIANYHLQISDDNKTWSNTTNPVLTQQDDQKNHSSSDGSCTVFAKLPQIDIRGADSFANGAVMHGENKSFAGSGSTLPMSGSFSQYAVMGNGLISNFGAGGWNANPDTEKSCIMSLANVLNKAENCNKSSPLGNAGLTRKTIGLPNYSLSSFTTITSSKFAYDSSAIGPYGTPNKPNLLYLKGDLTLDGGDGAYQYMNRVIYVEGNITITGMMTPFSTMKFNTISAIPNLTIIATGDIKINSSVTRIEANLVSMRGTINDCADSSDLKENGTCGQELSVKGAIISAKTPHFRRTYGAEQTGVGSPVQTPAEIVEYTPNVFLVPFSNTHGNDGKSDWKTVNTISMPARY